MYNLTQFEFYVVMYFAGAGVVYTSILIFQLVQVIVWHFVDKLWL